MATRLGQFIIFVLLSIITLGLYTLYFFVTRQQENIDVLREILEELKRNDARGGAPVTPPVS